MTRALALFALAGALSVGAGCHKKPSDPLEEATEALTSAGFTVEPTQPADPRRLSALACRQTKVEKVDALLCSYGSAEAQLKAESDAEGWIAQAVTGATARRGLVTLVLADRARVDANGKTIHKIATAFKKQ